jgi:DNA-binding NarL/FixJ family response regulator
MRVLVVDDHPLMQQAMRTALESCMDVVDVDFAASLEDALRMSRGGEQDLVLLDLNLPDASGTATIGAYCHRLPGRRVLAVSGDDDPHTVRACRNAGAAGFLPKRYGMRRAVGTICKVLAGEPAFPDPEAVSAAVSEASVRVGNGAARPVTRVSDASASGASPIIVGPAAGPRPAGGAHPNPLAATVSAPMPTPLPARAASLQPSLAPHPDGRHLGLTARQRQVLRLMLRGLPNKLICRELSLAEGTVKVHVSAVLRALNVANRAQVVVAATRAGIHLD